MKASSDEKCSVCEADLLTGTDGEKACSDPECILAHGMKDWCQLCGSFHGEALACQTIRVAHG